MPGIERKPLSGKSVGLFKRARQTMLGNPRKRNVDTASKRHAWKGMQLKMLGRHGTLSEHSAPRWTSKVG